MIKKIFHWFVFILLCFVILFLPLIIALCIFPLKSIELPPGREIGNQPQYLQNFESQKLTISTMIADLIQVPLHLKWYDVVFKYNIKPNHGWIMTKPMELVIQFLKGDPMKYGSDLSKLQTDLIFNDSQLTYKLSPSQPIQFTYLESDGFLYRGAAGGGEFQPDLSIPNNERDPDKTMSDEPMYKVYAKPNVIAWITKTIVIYLLCWGIILLVYSIIKLVKNFIPRPRLVVD